MTEHYTGSDDGWITAELIVDTDPSGWGDHRVVEFEVSDERDYAQVTLGHDDVKRLHSQLGSWLNGGNL
ncbi:Uncharacterised protein [Mycobacteroides abscessus subsp. massiliense]|uniref:hypothetical protein n=1 Tax=Mycobacteroides abscessus TaxID=36809 RepID=UPI0009A8A0F6|nr:hypothetical protein [Mycobacteroides abscessus]SKU70393.1 Uncharacterised protein [Mycobacteroides abscessus subsp. massiliense]SKU76618.1 Uncharacterised protein [Mycobacteroides abscessus subsp. massiliense]